MADVAVAQQTDQRPERSLSGGWATLFRWLPYWSFLRVVLIVSLLLLALPLVTLFFSPARSLLLGLFDLHWWGVVQVTVLLSHLASSLMVMTYLILINGGHRFEVELGPDGDDYGSKIRKNEGIWWRWLFFSLPAPILLAIGIVSSEPIWVTLLAMAGGIILSLVFHQFGLAFYYLALPAESEYKSPRIIASLKLNALDGLFKWATQHTSLPRLLQRPLNNIANRLPPYLGRGFIDYESDNGQKRSFFPGHLLAFGMLFLVLGLYFLVWIVDRTAQLVPALAYGLVLLLVLTWLLGGLAFIFDRYRVPLFRLILIVGLLTSLFRGSNYYYPVLDLRAALPEPLPIVGVTGDSIIVVAANGGGIQAAAWTAQVLTGIENQANEDLGARGLPFDRSIRFISAVSGGSVGAMHVVNAYTQAGLPESDAALDAIVDAAATSSIADVAWGLTYPDLLRTVTGNPFWSPTRPFFAMDRGRAIEDAWARTDARLREPLSSWRVGVREGWRPATVFNATLEETGERLLLSTAAFATPPRKAHLFAVEPSEPLDVSIATAARLSATFPYVAPAARAQRGDAELFGYHVVDGGYYDNYGMSTLVEWLDQTLQQSMTPDGNKIRRVLVLQIRGAPGADDVRYTFDGAGLAAPGSCPAETVAAAPGRGGILQGWMYQLTAPLGAMLHVRDTGQSAHNDVELELLRRAWAPHDVEIQTAVFQYYGADPPLSWHLTAAELKNIKAHWQAYVSPKTCFRGAEEQGSWSIVRRFLEEGAP